MGAKLAYATGTVQTRATDAQTANPELPLVSKCSAIQISRRRAWWCTLLGRAACGAYSFVVVFSASSATLALLQAFVRPSCVQLSRDLCLHTCRCVTFIQQILVDGNNLAAIPSKLLLLAACTREGVAGVWSSFTTAVTMLKST